MANIEQESLFLRGSKSVAKVLKSSIDQENKNIYIMGQCTRFMVDNVLKNIANNENYQNDAYIVLSSLNGKDFFSTSVLYMLAKLAGNVKISNKAVHNIIVTDNCLLLFSVADEIADDDKICGVAIYNKEQQEKACTYCKEIWNNGLPLHLQ